MLYPLSYGGGHCCYTRPARRHQRRRLLPCPYDALPARRGRRAGRPAGRRPAPVRGPIDRPRTGHGPARPAGRRRLRHPHRAPGRRSGGGPRFPPPGRPGVAAVAAGAGPDPRQRRPAGRGGRRRRGTRPSSAFRPAAAGADEWRVPLSAVAAAWLVSPPADLPADPSRYPWRAAARRADAVLLRNADVLTGTVDGLGDGGTTLRMAGRTGEPGRTVPLASVAAIAFDPTLARVRPPKGPYLRPRHRGRRPDHAGVGRRRGRHAPGRLPRSAGNWKLPLAEVIALDVAGGRAVLLSNLKPKRADVAAYNGLAWAWGGRPDRQADAPAARRPGRGRLARPRPRHPPPHGSRLRPGGKISAVRGGCRARRRLRPPRGRRRPGLGRRPGRVAAGARPAHVGRGPGGRPGGRDRGERANARGGLRPGRGCRGRTWIGPTPG